MDRRNLSAVPGERRHDLVDAVDRLVTPLDQILVLMKKHAAMQTVVLLSAVIAAVGAVIAVTFTLRLAAQLGTIEARVDATAKTSLDARDKAASAEKKLDSVERDVHEASKLRTISAETLPAPSAAASR